jgi:hypothetical protein
MRRRTFSFEVGPGSLPSSKLEAGDDSPQEGGGSGGRLVLASFSTFMPKPPTFIVKAPVFTPHGKPLTRRDGTVVWQDVGYAYRSGVGADERISVIVHVDERADYRCVLVKREADIETKYNRLRRHHR